MFLHCSWQCHVAAFGTFTCKQVFMLLDTGMPWHTAATCQVLLGLWSTDALYLNDMNLSITTKHSKI